MDIPNFVASALSRTKCPQPQDTFFSEFLQSQGKTCTECLMFSSGQCPGFNKILINPLDQAATLDALHNGNLDLIIIFEFLTSHSELRKFSHQSVTMAIALLCLNGNDSPLTDEELLNYLKQHFGSESEKDSIDKPKLQKAIRLIAEDIERLLQIRMPSTTI